MKQFSRATVRFAGLVALVVALALASTSVLRAQEPKGNDAPARVGERWLLSQAEIVRRVQQVLPTFDGTVGGRPACDILNSAGQRVRVVSPVQLGDPTYWFEYKSNDTFSTGVLFVAVPTFEGSPLDGIEQRFTFASDDSDVLTPFGIPVWAFDATSGPWLLVVQNSLGDTAVCPFVVRAE